MASLVEAEGCRCLGSTCSASESVMTLIKTAWTRSFDLAMPGRGECWARCSSRRRKQWNGQRLCMKCPPKGGFEPAADCRIRVASVTAGSVVRTQVRQVDRLSRAAASIIEAPELRVPCQIDLHCDSAFAWMSLPKNARGGRLARISAVNSLGAIYCFSRSSIGGVHVHSLAKNPTGPRPQRDSQSPCRRALTRGRRSSSTRRSACISMNQSVGSHGR